MPQALIERCKFQYLNNCKLFIYHHVAIQKTLSRLSFLDLGFFSPRSNSFLILSPIATRGNLSRPNCESDGKADNKRQAFINTDMRRFKIQTGDKASPPPPAGPH